MRTLVIRPGAIGDFILSLPAVECIRPHEIWASTANLPLIRFPARTRSIASTGLDLLGISDPPPRLLDDLRSFDRILSWYGANRAEFRSLVHELGLPFTFLDALPAQGSPVHAADFYLAQIRPFTDCPSDGIPRIPCEVERRHFAAIHPFSGSARKNWPLDRFRRLAAGLARRMPVEWCSGPDDPPLPGALRFDDLYQVACWLASAALYIGNDSGITHLAAAVGTPVLALFGPTDATVWAPRGPHVRIAHWSSR